MSDYPRPAGLDAFRRCVCPGCCEMVYGPAGVRCQPHGGPPAIHYTEADEYGFPRATADGPSPSAARTPE